MSAHTTTAVERGAPHVWAGTYAMLLLTACLWGGGALATAMQTSAAPPAWSVMLRMLIAGSLTLAYGAATRAPLTIPRGHRAMVMLQGALFFAAAFISFYHAVALVPSGVAALVLSTSPVLTALLAWLLFASRPTLALVAGALCGVGGIAITFAPNLAAGSTDAAGLVWGLGAALATSAGTLVGARNQRAGLPQIALIGWSAYAGAATAMLWALLAAEPFAFVWTARFIGSLAYLSIGASCLALSLYFAVVRRLGPSRAAYTLTLVPVVAMLLSALFEGLQLDVRTALGVAAVLLGNVLVLKKPVTKR